MSSPSLSVVIPTYNEHSNIEELVARLNRCLSGVEWEVIFVDDDSPDGTADLIASIARDDPRVRCLRRIGRRGLSTACIEGMASSTASYLAVMDADLQHDERLLPKMLQQFQEEKCDLAIGSRYVGGGSVGEWSKWRLILSRFATVTAQKLTRCPVADPMSGFFMLRRDVFLRTVHHLSGQGFKILLDIMASSPEPLRSVELPYQFRLRHSGESKLDSMVTVEYGFLLADKLFGRILPLRPVVFSLLAGSKLLVQLGVLWLLFVHWLKPFPEAQLWATILAVVYNFIVGNNILYREHRLKGRRILGGAIICLAVCTVGALANLQLSAYLFQLGASWWLAGLLGGMVLMVWDHAVTALFVWGRGRPKQGN